MSGELSFEQAPPPSVPMRFLLAAPVFGVAAGAVLAFAGSDALTSRWSGAALAIIHLLVAGFMLQAMTGALFQFMPVAAGGNVWRPRRVALFVQPLLIAGGMLLPAGLYFGDTQMLRAAMLAFAPGLAGLVVVMAVALWRTPAIGPTVMALRLAVAALAVTGSLGLVLAEGLAAGHGWPLADIANVHAAWGLAGWALVLLAGVSYAVVPMFQLTPAYPERLAHWLPRLLGLALLALTLGLLLPLPAQVPVLVIAGLAAGFAVVTLRLQHHRRRRIADAVLRFFRTAMTSLLVAAVLLAGAALSPTLADAVAVPWLLAALLIVGVFASAITGMAFKILPFISWLHLQREAGLQARLPNVAELLDSRLMIRQLHIHRGSLAVLLLVPFWPGLAVAAGVAMVVDFGFLAWLLFGTVRRYRVSLRRLAAASMAMPPQGVS